MPDFSSFGYDSNGPTTTPGGGFGGGLVTTDQASQFAASSPYVSGQNLIQSVGNIVGDVAASPVDLVDTVASSIPFISKAIGIKRGDVNQAALDAIGSPGLSDWYEQNKGGVAIASGVAGMVGAELLSGGLASAPGLVSVLSKASWGRKALSLDTEYTNAMKAVNIADTTMASQGLSGSRLFTDAMGEAGVPALADAGLDTSLATKGRNVLVTKAALLGTAKGVLHAATTEAIMGATLNQNDFLYSSSAGENIFNAAFGMGVGGLVGGIMAKYSIRKFANSDILRRINSEAMDPNGLNAARLTAPTTVNPNTPFGKKVLTTYMGDLQGARTDKIVSLMSDARAPVPAGVDTDSYERQATELTKIARNEMQKVTVKGFSGVDGTAFSMDSPGYGNHIDMLNHKDPSAMMGAEMVGGIGKGQTVTSVVDEFQTTLARRIQENQDLIDSDDWAKLSDSEKSNVLKNQKALKFQNRLVPVPYINGEATTMSNAAVLDEWTPPVIKTTSETTQAGDIRTYDAQDTGGNSTGVAYESNGNIIFNHATRTVNNASSQDMFNLFSAGRAHINSLVGDPKAVLEIPNKGYNWFHLDMAEQLLQKNPQATISWPAGLNRQSAQVESFAQKVDAIASRGEVPTQDEAAALRARFNLPVLTGYEAGLMGTSDTPADVILRGAIQAGGGDAVRKMSLTDILQGFDQQRTINPLAGKQSANSSKLQGNMFQFMSDDNGKEIKPIIMMKRPFMAQDYVPDNLAERIAMNKAQRVMQMVGPSAGDMTKNLQQLISSSPDSTLAANPAALSETQIASNLVPMAGNVAPSSGAGRLINGPTSAEWRARETPELLAAQRLRQSVDQMSQGLMKNMFETHLGPLRTQLDAPRNRASKYMLARFHDQGQGWDFKVPTTNRDGTINWQAFNHPLDDGSQGYHFPLEDTQGNRDRYMGLTGKEMPSGAILIDGQGKPILIDQLGMDFQQGFNKITDQLRIEKNTLNTAAGLPTISSKPFYIPPPNPEGKIMGFTYDPLGNVVPYGTVMANTQDEFNRIVNKLKADPNSIMNRDGHIFRPQASTEQYASLMDKAQMDMMSPGRTYIQGGKQAKGGLLTSQTNLGALDESLASVRDEILQHGRDVLSFNFDDQLKAAQMKSINSETPEAASKSAFGIKTQGKNIFDYYTEALTGRSPIKSSKSALGVIQNQIENLGDQLVAQAAKSGPVQLAQMAGHKIWASARDWTAAANPFVKSAEKDSVFASLQAKLGENMPFNTVADMMESQGYGQKPPTLRGFTQAVGKFESTWVLRMMEPMQAVMNLTGIPNAAPAVIRNLVQGAGESTADYAQRIGHAADIFTTPDGRSFSTLNMAKMMQVGFKRAWSGAMDADHARWASKGMVGQEVAEMNRAFNAADASRGGWDRFMNGDPNSSSKFMQKGLVGWTSLLTDKSEDFSRLWAHTIGDEVGRFAGITDTAARDNFAHDLANKMIANYNPQNRPAMFQGVVGTPIGLFQGFIWAYYQRMFRYLETGNARALATQYATQAASFGLKTVPGFQEVNDMYFKHSDGHNDPYDSIVERLGPGASDALMGGVWGNLPRLFGGQAIDLASRGDTSFRTPVLTAPAAVSTAQKIMTGVGQGIGLFTNKNPHLSSQQVAEIVSNTLPNRPMAGMIEQFGAGGADTDASGQLVSQSHTWMDTAARILGTRTMTQSNDLNAFYENKQMAEIRAQQAETLNANTRGLIRAGNTEDLQGVYEAYISNGGDPRQYKAWVKRSIDTATKTRSQRQLHDMMHNPANQDAVNRLLSQSTGITAEENQPDPAQTMVARDTMNNQQPTADVNDSSSQMYDGPSAMMGNQ